MLLTFYLDTKCLSLIVYEVFKYGLGHPISYLILILPELKNYQSKKWQKVCFNSWNMSEKKVKKSKSLGFSFRKKKKPPEQVTRSYIQMYINNIIRKV